METKIGPLKLSMRIAEFFVVVLAMTAFARVTIMLMQSMTHQERVLWLEIQGTNIPVIIVLAFASAAILPFYGYTVLTRWLEKRDIRKIEQKIIESEAYQD